MLPLLKPSHSSVSGPDPILLLEVLLKRSTNEANHPIMLLLSSQVLTVRDAVAAMKACGPNFPDKGAQMAFSPWLRELCVFLSHLYIRPGHV